MIKREELTDPASCMSRALDDEMTFVLLGRDAAAPFAIRCWVMERIRLAKNRASDPQIIEALASARVMESSRGGDGIKPVADGPQFEIAASLILDAVEEAFGIIAPKGRGDCHDSIVRILEYFCLPKPERVAT